MARLQKQKSGQKGSKQSSPQELVSQSKGCILFVDDDELIIEMGQEMLACLGYETVGQMSGCEALKVFREAPHRFDLVVTDLNMPDMKGDILAQHLWGIRPDIPIILCTGGRAVTREKALLRGFDALLAKPFGVSDIAVAIEQALTQRTAHKI